VFRDGLPTSFEPTSDCKNFMSADSKPSVDAVPPIAHRSFPILRATALSTSPLDDQIAIEEPLEIRIVTSVDGVKHDRSVSITMRTPGHDAELAAGFLVTEGILKRRDDVQHVRPCRSGSVVRVRLRNGLVVDWDRLQRHVFTSSSCGVCGKSTIDSLHTQIATPLIPAKPMIARSMLMTLPGKLRAMQPLFEKTGGVHASGLFSTDGNLCGVFEDVGRHNALDKLIGNQWLSDASVFASSILVVSGRVSFELVQKALVVGIPCLVAVGAPSSLAVELANEHAMSLVGFTKPDQCNVYADNGRIQA